MRDGQRLKICDFRHGSGFDSEINRSVGHGCFPWKYQQWARVFRDFGLFDPHFSRVSLKMILVELQVSISTLATSISRIVNSITRRSFRGLARSTIAPPLNEMTFAHVESCISFLIVEWLLRIRLIHTPPPSTAKLWEPKFALSISV